MGKTSNISRSILQKFQTSYENSEITEENIFYYVYELLHSKEWQHGPEFLKDIDSVGKLKITINHESSSF